MIAHVYLGSRRHMMRRVFSDADEPFLAEWLMRQ